MIAVVFEVWPASGRKDDYLAIAATLRAELETIDGFISVERFQSLTDPGKLLSLSFWRDEDAVQRWRNTAHHRESQAAGRGGVFADYAKIPASHSGWSIMMSWWELSATYVVHDGSALHSS
jgi:heme-degrading monooxygenase HmoA